MINALSFDLEYWYNAESIKDYLPERREDLIIESTIPILDLLDRYDVRATFFVLGTVAEKYPELIETIYEKGHEIASHGYSHTILHDLGEEKFKEEIEKSVDLLGTIAEKPIGFRAPRFSIDSSTKWSFKVLEQYGFKYDSSIFPIKIKAYGVPNAPLSPYTPSMDDITKSDQNGGIVEFPLSVFRIGANVPISGGFYLRVIPFSVLKLAIRSINKKRPAIIYIHPWETYNGLPKLKMPIIPRFINRYGVDSALNKLEGLLKNFEFKPVREVLVI